MSYPMFRTLSAVTFAALLLTLAPIHASAQTPDGETPANEGVCDGLRADGTTKGLYGLCVAYCEAQDCVPNLDGTLPTSCEASQHRILDNYNKKKQPGDPDMPCVKQACPCWDQAELDAAASFPAPPFVCNQDLDPRNNSDSITYFDFDLPSTRLLYYVDVFGKPAEGTPFRCQYFRAEPGQPDISRLINTTPEEDATCRAQVQTLIDAALTNGDLGTCNAN